MQKWHFFIPKNIQNFNVRIKICSNILQSQPFVKPYRHPHAQLSVILAICVYVSTLWCLSPLPPYPVDIFINENDASTPAKKPV